jgi:hypothetical protein
MQSYRYQSSGSMRVAKSAAHVIGALAMTAVRGNGTQVVLSGVNIDGVLVLDRRQWTEAKKVVGSVVFMETPLRMLRIVCEHKAEKQRVFPVRVVPKEDGLEVRW